MNDRFKFRYVHKNKIYEASSIDFGNELIETTVHYHPFNYNPDKLLQCTRLKDKNDPLIYEGDIVKYTSKPSKSNPNKEPYTENFKAAWVRISYVSQRVNSVNYKNIAIELEQLEVISNIYENPELLTTPRMLPFMSSCPPSQTNHVTLNLFQGLPQVLRCGSGVSGSQTSLALSGSQGQGAVN